MSLDLKFNRLDTLGLVAVTTTTWTCDTATQFAQPFNQATFLNYDTLHPVTIIDSIVIPPAQVVTGGVQPGQFKINLNTGEVNQSPINIKFVNGSTTNNVVVIYTQYAAKL